MGTLRDMERKEYLDADVVEKRECLPSEEAINSDGYVELHCVSNFSFLRGASHPEELVKQAIALKYSGLALTDECSLAGVVRAFSAVRALAVEGFKLIIGSEFFTDDDEHVVLLAPTRQAYAQLSELITLARGRKPKGEYSLTLNDIKCKANACLVLWLPKRFSVQDTACMQRYGDTAKWLLMHFEQQAWILFERKLLQGEDVYLTHLDAIAEEYQLPIASATGVLMHDAQRHMLLDTLAAINTLTPIERLGEVGSVNNESVLRPLKKIQRLYRPEWIKATQVIARQCQFCLSQLRYEYPQELIPSGKTATEYLRELVERGKVKRFPEGISERIEQLIEKELSLIASEGYEYFFLTVYDIVCFAQQQGILYQGRGSAANSVVCYCLFITAVDPEKVDVLFERFISKERREAPDIDVDFEHERREEVIQYIYQKYGRHRAALTATVITYRFKSAVRDVGKALGFSDDFLSLLIKQIDRRDTTIPWYEQVPTLTNSLKQGIGKRFVQLVEQIKGFPRHLSQHVGGFVIAANRLSDLVPIENAAMAERSIIQWDKDDLETLGLLKVDILALGMLTAIRKCFALIELHYGIPMSMEHVQWEDPNVYKMLQRADTVGVFQIESRAQSNMLPRLKPACYYDLVVQVAIVRPGPIQGDMVHPYLRRRDGKEVVEYPSEAVKKVLSRTLGVPIFQEQVIQLAMVAAGFSGGEADQLRRSMARWKKDGSLGGFENKLIEGMRSRGYDVAFAERIFKQICGFGEYGFPESHAASFALLAYVSAWLKCYFPAAYACALLNSQPMGFFTPSQIVKDAERHDVVVLPMHINHSHWQHTLTPAKPLLNHTVPLSSDKEASLNDAIATAAVNGDNPLWERFAVEPNLQGAQAQSVNTCTLSDSQVAFNAQDLRDNQNKLAIRLGFRLINGLGKRAVERLVEQRPAIGFQNYAQVLNVGLAKDQIEALASANVFSDWSSNRFQARWELAGTDRHLPLFAHVESTCYSDSHIPEQLSLLPPSEYQNLVEDIASFNLTLGKHPLAFLREKQRLVGCTASKDLLNKPAKSVLTIAGVVTGKQRPGTASGVTFITLEDEWGDMNVVVWGSTAQHQRHAYLTSRVLKVTGVIEIEQSVVHVIAGKLTDITDELAGYENLPNTGRFFR